MEILLALLLMLWGNVQDHHPQTTFEQIIQATQTAYQAAEEQAEREEMVDGQFKKRDPQAETAPVVRGIFATAHSAGGARFQTLLDLIDETELNAMVIDVKEDKGLITYKIEHPLLQELGTMQPIIRNIDEVIQTLEEHDIYPIARIVVFKDTLLAEKRPDLAFKNPDGTVWANSKGESFVNPYKEEVWEYNIEVAKEAIKAGFKEIQFDYVRFPEGFEKRADTLVYETDERKRIEVVSDFVKHARKQLAPLGARISVDIFGYAASVPAAEGIGQDFNEISKYVDVISPMVYPSHYSTGWYGSKVPDAAPYQTIDGAMKDTHKKLEEIGDLKPIIRPWIQDFTATWVPGYIRYGKKEVEAQIQAMKDNGIHEFLLWNSSNVYTPDVDYILE